MRKQKFDTVGDCSGEADIYYHYDGTNILIDKEISRYIPWSSLRNNEELIIRRIKEIKGVRRAGWLHHYVWRDGWLGYEVQTSGRESLDTIKRRINFALCISGDSFGSESKFVEWLGKCAS